VETFTFDAQYITALQNRVPDVESHFVAYFKMPIWLKARRQLRSADLVEDALQETLLRVLRYFRSGKTLQSPERLPAFVHSVCHNVTLEMLRTKARYLQVPENRPEPIDVHDDVELRLVTEERKRLVREILNQLPEKDRELLRLAMLEEMEGAELCRRFGVTQDYLRVLLHRARQRFRTTLEKAEATAQTKRRETA
jgi:RNA polymerase sigma-70 factor (ECF subfamily)